MYGAGYNAKDREIVARRVIAKLDNDLNSYLMEGKPYYRSKETRKDILKINKSTWFRKMGATANPHDPHHLRIHAGQKAQGSCHPPPQTKRNVPEDSRDPRETFNVWTQEATQ